MENGLPLRVERDATPPSSLQRKPTDRETKQTRSASPSQGNLALEFGPIQLTSYAGLELFGRWWQQVGFNALVRDVFAGNRVGGDFGPVTMVRVLMAVLLVGGRRLRHVAFLQDDPLVQRFSGVRVVPTARTRRQDGLEGVGRRG